MGRVRIMFTGRVEGGVAVRVTVRVRVRVWDRGTVMFT